MTASTSGSVLEGVAVVGGGIIARYAEEFFIPLWSGLTNMHRRPGALHYLAIPVPAARRSVSEMGMEKYDTNWSSEYKGECELLPVD